MLLRVLVVSLLLGALIFIQAKQTQTYFGHVQTFHYLLIATVYFVSLIYVILLKFFQKFSLQAYIQLFFDTVVITAVIYSTGGIDSIFSFLYILSIISGGIILYRKGGMIIASACSILYGLLLDLHYYGLIHPVGTQGSSPERYQSAYIFFIVLANMVGFYVSAYLSSYLSEQAREKGIELEEKQRDFDKLEVLNESIINSITSGLVALDGQDNIILFNPAAEKIFGTRANQVCGQPITEALPHLGAHLAHKELQWPQFPRNRPMFSDFPYPGPDGKGLHLRLSVSPLSLTLGGRRGQILIFQDVTEAKEIEEEMKKVEGLAMIGELAAGIAHEIRNPMASISGSIEMLKEGLEKDDVNSRLMDIISREINRLNHLVNDFLLFARPKETSLREFDLNQLILESLELFKNSQYCTQDINTHTDFRHEIRLKSDPEQIKQVLWNLFLNASEAMDNKGTIYVTAGLESNPREPDRERVRIVVRDTGKGFDKKVLSQLFIPFFTTKERGSGLGLAIVKRIVEALQGQVFGENHPKGGAVFTIYLPISN